VFSRLTSAGERLKPSHAELVMSIAKAELKVLGARDTCEREGADYSTARIKVTTSLTLGMVAGCFSL
jgi:hypothetical protein